MTIDEAIAHCLEVAGEQQVRADFGEMIGVFDELDVEACRECAADHRQLAEWLQELKEWRENPFKMIKDICAVHEWCPDCQLSDHCIRASGWALSYPSEWEVE